MRGTDGCRGNTVPLRSEPARCQVPEDLLECSATVNGEESWDVLDEEPCRVELAEDSEDEGPEPSLVVDALPFPGDAGALTWKTGNDEIHSAAIRFAVEGFQIVPDRTWIQGTFAHSTCEDGSRIGLPLDSSHSPNSRASANDGAIESAVSGAERDEGSGTKSHIDHVSSVTSEKDRTRSSPVRLMRAMKALAEVSDTSANAAHGMHRPL